MDDLIKQLERIISIDGMGRPARARLLLELIKEFGIENIAKELKEIGKRKFI